MREKPTVKIWRTSNGYIMQSLDTVEVCEEEDNNLSVCRAAQHLLYAVLEAMGAYGSKHDKYRVRISVIDRDTGKEAEDEVL